jgi:hypothetical protein
MIWIVELVVLLLFVGFGGVAGFIAWAVLFALLLFARHFHNQAQLKAAELVMQTESSERHARLRAAELALLAERPVRREPAPVLPAPPPVPAQQRSCSKCNVANDADADFCAACGSPFVAAQCECGVVNRAGAAFCKKCGRKSVPARAADGPMTPSASSPAISAGRGMVESDSRPRPSSEETLRGVANLSDPRSSPRKRKHPAPLVPLKECEACRTANRGDAYRCTNCGDLFAAR